MRKYEEGGPQQQHPPRSARVLFQLYAQEEEEEEDPPLIIFFKREKVFPVFFSYTIYEAFLFSIYCALARSLVVQITTTPDEMGCRL